MPIRILEEKGVPYTLRQQARKQYTAEGVAEDLGVPLSCVVKAMIVRVPDQGFSLFVIRGDHQLSLKKVGAALGEKRVELASQRDVERVTGYQVGAVSVLGFRRDDVPSYLDGSVLELEWIVISSGRPDMGLEMRPGDLQRCLKAQVVDVAY